MSNVAQYKINSTNLRLYTLFAALLTAFLFFIDEGYYNFDWMLSFGHWIVFGIYTVVILSFQLIIELLVPSRWAAKVKIVPFSFFVGSILALVILFASF